MEKLFTEMIQYVIGSLLHNWLPLSLAILTAAIITVHVNPEKLKQSLLQKSKISIWTSVAFGAFTPLCACGTMAVVLGLLSTALPWGPIMAFLTSSPLMSPDGFILVAGIINLKFAIALTAASLAIGLGSGYATHLIEKKTTFLKAQVRFAKHQKTEKNEMQACGCAGKAPAYEQTSYEAQACCAAANGGVFNRSVFYCGAILLKDIDYIATQISEWFKKMKWREIDDSIMNVGVKQILLYYSLFAAIGFLFNRFVPSSIIVTLFNAENIFAVPLAALIGLPMYVNGESAIPLIQSLMASGASGGAMLAFLITGTGTSAGVIAGISTIMRKRAIFLYVLFLLVGGIFLGYLYDMLLALGV